MMTDGGRLTTDSAMHTMVDRQPLAVIRPASLGDLFAVHALEKACFGTDAWGYIEIVLALATPGQVRLKAVTADTLVGLVIGDPRPFEGVGWIATIGVHPSYQRRGIGEALLSACEAALPQQVIKLTVRASNSSAMALYRKRGYQRAGVWQRYYAGSEDGIVMEKHK